MTWIQTYTGKRFDVVTPTPDMVCIEDISWALAHQCRFAGHTTRFYSVAEHCITGALHFANHPAQYRLAALFMLHDASEAYLVDLPRPVKHLMPKYVFMEQCIMDVIYDHFGIAPPNEQEQKAIKYTDDVMLMSEKDKALNKGECEWEWQGPQERHFISPAERPHKDVAASYELKLREYLEAAK